MCACVCVLIKVEGIHVEVPGERRDESGETKSRVLCYICVKNVIVKSIMTAKLIKIILANQIFEHSGTRRKTTLAMPFWEKDRICQVWPMVAEQLLELFDSSQTRTLKHFLYV